MKPAVIILNQGALPLARQIAEQVAGQVHAPVGSGADATAYESLGAHLRMLFGAGTPIIAIMAAGALIRILAPCLADKRREPAVVAVSDDGRSFVPLLGGHHGANAMASALAVHFNGHAALTTAGDSRFGIALDAPPPGYAIENPEQAKPVMAALLAGETARLDGDAPWLASTGLPFSSDGRVRLTVSDAAMEAQPLQLLFRPRRYVLGMGAERGAPVAEALELAHRILASAGISPHAVAMVATLDVKADEAALNAVADRLGVPLRLFDAARLEAETPRLANPSEIVFAEVGCHGVAEGAALAAAGAAAELAVPKQKSARVTAALARAPAVLEATGAGRGRGSVHLVGVGPGQPDWRSPEASAAILSADDLVGYGLYLDLVADLVQGQQLHAFPLGAEELRVRHAFELAGQGRRVALVCSGDAGIYAMASLAFELLDHGSLPEAAQRVEISVCPGISALQAAAARSGAPLGHDFCTISLSDLLTPWPVIENRVRAAAEGDFVIAFYNPVSRKRRTQLASARETLLKHRPPETPVVLATNLGRADEHVRLVTLQTLDVDAVDMLTVVIVGSSNTQLLHRGDGRSYAYTPRGYQQKPGSGMGKSQ